MARKKREAKPIEFDMTPMIDVTFQLLIFFILTMKIKTIERREAADLPQDEGPSPHDAQQKDFLTLRMFWQNQIMTYEVNSKFGNNMGKGPNAIHGGTLPGLISDRTAIGNGEYRKVFNNVLQSLQAKAAKIPTIEGIELTYSLDTKVSSKAQIADTAPWGFVTLALDACTEFNKQRRAQGEKELTIKFKNTEPSGTTRVG